MKQVLKLSIIALLFVSCKQTVENGSVSNAQKITHYEIIADSIRLDSTIAHNKIVAMACEKLFDRKFIDTSNHKLNTDLLQEYMSVDSINGQTLLKINYHSTEKVNTRLDLYLIGDEMQILSHGKIPSQRGSKLEVKIKDWNKDGEEELVVDMDQSSASVSFMEHFHSVYCFDNDLEFKQIFELVTETRNCTPVMEENWNWRRREYEFVDSKNVLVKEGKYLYDCEQYERTGQAVKLRTRSVTRYLLTQDSKTKKFKLGES